ncbi:MAG TPA: hypothetical protein VGC77_09635 [Rhodopseudomonas sp.]|uniref:hypothetical protein n=1 Tax=Rhodopseudomonas sp. TaxID=1078 RepID=UPI002ED7CEDB
MTATYRDLLHTFANGRCRAGMVRLAPGRDFATRWQPKVGRERDGCCRRHGGCGWRRNSRSERGRAAMNTIRTAIGDLALFVAIALFLSTVVTAIAIYFGA